MIQIDEAAVRAHLPMAKAIDLVEDGVDPTVVSSAAISERQALSENTCFPTPKRVLPKTRLKSLQEQAGNPVGKV